MRSEATVIDVLLTLVTFAAGAASFACALIVLFQDRETLSALYAFGGVWLALWAGTRAVD